MPSLTQKSINRFGLVTESNGSISFSTRVVTCDPRATVALDLEAVAKQQKSISIKKSVDEMVNNYKATGSVSNNIINTTLLRASTSSNLLKASSNQNLQSLAAGTSISTSASVASNSLLPRDSTQSLDVKNILHANEK